MLVTTLAAATVLTLIGFVYLSLSSDDEQAAARIPRTRRR